MRVDPGPSSGGRLDLARRHSARLRVQSLARFDSSRHPGRCRASGQTSLSPRRTGRGRARTFSGDALRDDRARSRFGARRDRMSALPFIVGDTLPHAIFRKLRLRTIFECFKWDPQVEDTSVLAPFPIFLSKKVWTELAQLAGQLAQETIAAELEILQRPELLKALALPRTIWKLLAGTASDRAGWKNHPRVMRFDFHFTTEGWRISEVNSDVPGGFIEADGFTQLMAEACGAEA